MTPPQQPPLEQALSDLFRRNLHAIKLDLDPMRALVAELGNPQDAFLSIHVAGTNGKGSCCAMIAAMLQALGLRTGLYTSPHLVRFHERIRINGEPIADADLAARLADVEAAAQRAMAAGSRDATFFEFTTALAFEHFRRSGAQVAVLETGMGGRLDATNVVTPVVSVITSIGMDHMQYLGDTIEKIAAEKAGILKPGHPAVMADLLPEAAAVIRRVAKDRGVVLTPAIDTIRIRRTRQALDGQRLSIETEEQALPPLTLPLPGMHQIANCAAAVAAVQVFARECRLPAPAEALKRGLEATRWPARLQVVETDPPLIIDGAHNADAARVAFAALDELRGKRPLGCILGFLNDKDVPAFLREMVASTRRAWVVPIQSARAMSVDDVAALARNAALSVETATDLPTALSAARRWAREQNGFLCITGSLYLAGEALAHLSISAA